MVDRPDRAASSGLPADAVGEAVARYVELLETEGAAAAEASLSSRPELLDAVREQLARLRRMGLLASQPGETASVPPKVAHYTVLERLGTGGMGEVYLAEQREPVRRRVALKVIKVGLASKEVLARFDVERQALALMTHANVARVLDAGSTEQGQPYFAMEYVPGLAITAYCNQRRLHTNERLELVLAVCEAVQHAHFKGVIHRDLKPSNILVTEQDGRAAPKIIDFGVAKAVAVGLGSGSVFTTHGMVVGTPEYMSPEQAGRGELDVDTRTDVYSLGVLLYELLTGSLPFSSERLRSGGLEQMLSIIRDEPPPRPSTRVSAQGEDTRRVAAAQSTDPAQLRQKLRGDLDWIVLKALEKDRNRRYQTPALLAVDLRRFLANEAIEARPPSFGYRLAKFVRRNRLAVGLALTTMAAMTAGLVVSLFYYRDARASALAAQKARSAAEDASAAAEANFGSAMQAVDDMLSRVGDTSLVHIPQMEGVRRDLLRRARTFYEGFAKQRATDPNVRLKLAKAQDRVGRIEGALGDQAAARRAHETALATIGELLTATPDDPELRELRAGVQSHLAYVMKATSGNEARELFQSALTTLRDLASSAPPTRQRRRLLSEVCAGLSEVETTRDVAAGVELMRESVGYVEAVVADDPDDIESAAVAVSARLGLAAHEYRRRNLAVARELVTKADDDAQALLARAPERIDMRRARCRVQDLLAGICDDQGDGAAAETAARAANARWRELVQAFPLNLDARAALAQSLSNAAAMLQPENQRDFDPLTAEALAIYEDLCRQHPDNVIYRRGLCVTLVSRGGVMASQDTEGRAGVTLIERGCEELTRLSAERPEDSDFARLLVSARWRLGQLQAEAGDLTAARANLTIAVAAARRWVEGGPFAPGVLESHVQALLALARLDLQTGDPGQAAANAEVALSRLQAAAQRVPPGAFRGNMFAALHVRAQAALATGDLDVLRANYSEVRAQAQRAEELLACATLSASMLRGGADDVWFREQATAALRAAVAAGLTGRTRIASDPRFAELRDDTEFQAAVAAVPN